MLLNNFSDSINNSQTPKNEIMQTWRIKEGPIYLNTHLNFMEKLDQLIITNLSNEAFCIADLERHLLLSSSQIYRKIKEQTGHSPSVYIRNQRLKYAEELMLQSDLSLSEIAYRVGFNGLSYFSRCFSK